MKRIHLGEYGADPANWTAVELTTLRLKASRPTGLGGVVFQFNAVADKSYSILQRSNVELGVWQKWMDVEGVSTNRVVTITNTSAGVNRRFFRLATPKVP